MKSLEKLFTSLLFDLGGYCSVDTTRDVKYFTFRARHEGISFYTISLPNFAQGIEDALERGYAVPTDFLGFKKKACLPAFLQGFTGLMFDDAGVVKDGNNGKDSIAALYCVRQFCRFAKKLLIPCSENREKDAFRKYRDTDAGLLSPRDCVSFDQYVHFKRTASAIWTSVFDGEDRSFDLIPKHGPGATAQRISGNQKYRLREWHKRLERVFPFSGFGVHNEKIYCDSPPKVKYLSNSEERPVRVISVPKTLKTPRIIAIEPVCMQYTQQAVSRFITASIDRSRILNGSIRFNDQTFNQAAAMSSSLDKSMATLDLSEASDRVHLHGVVDMLSSIPWLLKATLACRSKTAEVPKIGKIRLRKFASMGSALCFPIEAMYFLTTIVHGILWKQGLPASSRNVSNITKRVHIFGDDIIVPTDETDTVVEVLQLFGAKVNRDKSHWKSNFRESCGTDAFHGVNITPVYLRRPIPQHRRDSSGIVSTVSTSNQLHMAGLWKSAAVLKDTVEALTGKLPTVLETTPGLGWTSFLGYQPVSFYCKNLQTPLVRTYVVRPTRAADALDGYPALLKCFLTKSEETSQDHLEYTSRHGAVSKKRSWVNVY